MDELEPIPELPLEIKEAALDGRLVLFVGAGASMLLGMPSWSGLALKVLEQLREDKKINYSELEQLKKLKPKIQLSIAKQIARSEGCSLNLKQYLKPTKNSQIYDFINSIGAACVTTNYDHELSPVPVNEAKKDVFSEEIEADATKPPIKRVFDPKDFKVSDLDSPGTVTHLHGDMVNPDKMIVSTESYLNHYDREEVQHFLKSLFKTKIVLLRALHDDTISSRI